MKYPIANCSPGLRRNRQGFSLVELLIVIVIIAILAGIAIPSYQNSIAKSRRTLAKTALLDLAARQEKFFSTTNKYTSDMGATGLGIPSTTLSDGNITLYTLEMTVNNTSNPPTFTATAKPAGPQTKDTCGNYTVNNFGQQTPTTSGCW